MPKPPSDQGSIKAFEHYKKILEDMQVKSVNHATKQNGDTTSLEHILWMCNHCIPQVTDDGRGFPVDKYSRWLGFIQGVLICKMITTVEAERDRTRPWFTKS